MARATSHKAADSYRARDAASWTEEKLMILDAYLKAFAKACAKAGGRVRLRVQEELGQATLFDMKSGPRKRRLNSGQD